MKKEKKTNGKPQITGHTWPAVCPAGQRDDIKRHLNLPCPDEHSLEEEYRWREEHIQ